LPQEGAKRAPVKDFVVRDYCLTKWIVPAQEDMRPFLALDGKSRFFQNSDQLAP
jgi:hypothetical protein